MPAWRGSTHASGTGPGRGGRETSAAVPAGGVRRGGARARRAWGRPRPPRVERRPPGAAGSEEHTAELQAPLHLVCRLLLEKKNIKRPSARVHIVQCAGTKQL